MFKRIRKAIIAGVLGGIGAAATVLIKSPDITSAEAIGQAVGALLAAGIPIGYATWRVPNSEDTGPATEVDPGLA